MDEQEDDLTQEDQIEELQKKKGQLTSALTIPEEIRPIRAKIFALPRCYPPERVMANPGILRENIVQYFHLLEPPNHPTPPGLAMAMGLSSFDSVLRIIKNEEAAPGFYPEESIEALLTARSLIEDYYINGGLREALPSQFVKFLLSAYFNRSEKTIQESLGSVDNSFTLNILGVSGPMPLQLSGGAAVAAAHAANHPQGESLSVCIEGIGCAEIIDVEADPIEENLEPEDL